MLAHSSRFIGEDKTGDRLARDCVFGEKVMSHCTVYGHRGNAALPLNGIVLIKETILLKCFPMMMNDPAAFKQIRKSCIDAINHASSKLRVNLKKRSA